MKQAKNYRSANANPDGPSYVDPLLNNDAAAKILGFHPNTLKRWRCEKIGPPYIKLGGNKNSGIRYRLSDLHAYIEASRVVMAG